MLLQQLSLLSVVVFLPLAAVAVVVPFLVHVVFVVFVRESFLRGNLALAYGSGSCNTVEALFLPELLLGDDWQLT